MAHFKYLARNDDAVFVLCGEAGQKTDFAVQQKMTIYECYLCWGHKRVIYRGAFGNWIELLHEGADIIGTRSLDERERRLWQEWLIGITDEIPELK